MAMWRSGVKAGLIGEGGHDEIGTHGRHVESGQGGMERMFQEHDLCRDSDKAFFNSMDGYV